MDVGYYLKRWLNSGVDEAHELALTNIISVHKALWIKFTFGRGKQSKFLQHFLSIKGESNAKKPLEIINLMMMLYEEADTLDAPLIRTVLSVIHGRISEGQQMHSAMMGLFDSSFIMIMRASAVGTKKQGAITSETYNKVIKRATEDSIEIAKMARNTTIKMLSGASLIISAMFVCSSGSQYYQGLITEKPGIDRFITIPHTLYAIGDIFVEYFPYAMMVIMLFLMVQRYALRHYLGEFREELDKYWPPFIIFRYFSGLNIFSGLSLLISHIGYESLQAVEALYGTATPYEQYHLDMMKDKLGEGEAGTRQLDTGLLTKDLQLTLRMAGEGETSSIRTALQIIDTQGKASMILKLKTVSTFFMILMIMFSIVISVQVLAASAFLFQESAGI